jgi:hypothetical protein
MTRIAQEVSMSFRTATLGILAAAAVALAWRSAPSFTLQSTGAVTLHATGHHARFGVVPRAVRGRPILIVSLGATASEGAMQLTVAGDRPPAPGRYPIRSSWDELGTDANSFHASFMPGSVERPLGWYHGESGWVTITEARSDRMSGTFEVRARGFTAADPVDEEQWVTVRGSFEATGDSTVTTISSIR